MTTIQILLAIVQAIVVMLLAPLSTGFARWLRAKMHTRKGPPILQDYYDIIKLFKRQDVHTADSSFVHRIMPAIYVGTMLVLALGMPMTTRFCPVPILGDIILIILMLALPRFFFALSALDTGDAYAGIGATRELVIGVFVERAMMVCLFVAAVATSTTNIGVMGGVIGAGEAGSFGIAIAGIAFFLACYVELGKLPFDSAEAEQELQEGPLQEYSGPSLALCKIGMSMKQVIVISWFIAIFLPFGSAIDASFGALAIGLVVYILKIVVIFVLCDIFENLVSRVRWKLIGNQTWVICGIAIVGLILCVLGL